MCCAADAGTYILRVFSSGTRIDPKPGIRVRVGSGQTFFVFKVSQVNTRRGVERSGQSGYQIFEFFPQPSTYYILHSQSRSQSATKILV